MGSLAILNYVTQIRCSDLLKCSSNASDTSVAPACLSSALVLPVEVVSVSSVTGNVDLCGTVCKTVFNEVTMVGVFADEEHLNCWCFDSNTDIRELSPDLYCNRECGGSS